MNLLEQIWSDISLKTQAEDVRELTAQRNALFARVVQNADAQKFVAVSDQLAERFEQFRLDFLR